MLDHLLLAAAGLWPRSHWLGSNWTHLPAQQRRAQRNRHHDRRWARSGCDAAGARGARGLRGAGQLLLHRRARDALSGSCPRDRAPAVTASRITRNGTGTPSRCSDRGAWPPEIAQAQECIAQVTGETPRFFRAPAGLRNPFLEPILSRLKLQLVSWTRRGFDTVNADADDVYRRLCRSLRDGDILLLHDGHAARAPIGAPAAGTPVILKCCPVCSRLCGSRQLRPVSLRATLA